MPSSDKPIQPAGGHTALILADQLAPDNPALAGADRVVFVESLGAMRGRRYHRARLQVVFSAMRHRAAELRNEGREVIEIRAAESVSSALVDGGWLGPAASPVVCQRPESFRVAQKLAAAGVQLTDGGTFVADTAEFAEWAAGRKRITMEFFYRRMRTEHNLLLDTDGGPEGGKWNLDSENRRPPKEGLSPPQPWLPTEDEIDAQVRGEIEAFETKHGISLWGNGAPREFAVTASEAKTALDDFIANRLAGFGPWQDAMVPGEDTMFHARISVPLNLGLLDPLEACRAAEAAYRAGAVPLQSAEGFIRQIIGWREFVRCMYRLREGEWETDNALGASLPLPPAFYDPSATDWQCLSSTIETVDRTGYAHHIERLMVLGNSMLLLGVEPHEALAWFRESFVDAADWVMAPNVLGMGIHADGGVMMTKPYAAGGNYMNRMSRHCSSCRYDPKQRKGEDACPLTAMYWEFLDRHRERFAANPRMSLAIRNLERIDPAELKQVIETAEAARGRIARGETPKSG